MPCSRMKTNSLLTISLQAMSSVLRVLLLLWAKRLARRSPIPSGFKSILSSLVEHTDSSCSWTVVNVFMFLHLLDLAQADIACEKIFKLLRPQSGSMVIGADTGNTEAGELVLRPPMCEPGEHRTIYRHSQETMKEMWERVAAKLGLKVKVTSEYDKYEMEEREKGLRESKNWEEENRFFAGSTERRVFFSVELL